MVERTLPIVYVCDLRRRTGQGERQQRAQHGRCNISWSRTNCLAGFASQLFLFAATVGNSPELNQFSAFGNHAVRLQNGTFLWQLAGLFLLLRHASAFLQTRLAFSNKPGLYHLFVVLVSISCAGLR